MRVLFPAVLLAFAAACEPERATVRVLGASTLRAVDKSVVVDVDVEAHEGLGGNVGRYCVSVQWPFEPNYDNQCSSDLEDGDTKSLHFISKRKDIAPGGLIRVRTFTSVETGALDLNAPP